MIAPFVTWPWCQARAAEQPLVLVDSRWYWDRDGSDAYRQGHLPGAVFADVSADLSAPRTERSGRFPLPSARDFADRMGVLGIDGTAPVVAYDDAGGVIAARIVWMLRSLGVDAAVLSGGITSFPGTLETKPRRPEPVPPLQAADWPADRIADIDDLLATDAAWLLVDARPSDRFHGQKPPADPRLGRIPQADPRDGHIPGARNVACRSHLLDDDEIAAPQTVAATFAAAGITDDIDPSTVVSYCGAGVTACHNLLAMEHAGLGVGRLYPGSWSEWSRRPELPIETG